MKIDLRIPWAAAGALGVLLAAGKAAAVDNKTYMGAFCVPSTEEDRGRMSSVNGTVSGASGTAVNTQVVCPIIKNVTTDSQLENVTIKFSKTSASTLKCNLNAFRANVVDGFTSNIVAHAEGSVSGTGSKTMTFTSFAAGLGAPWTSNFIYYTLDCSLPSGDYLQHYQVRETGTRTESAKIYPPMMCRPDIASSTARYYFQYGNTFPGAESPGGWLQSSTRTGSGSFVMVCPVITDRTPNTAGTMVASISLGRPISAGLSLSCTLYESDNSLPFDSTTATFASGAEFPTQTFDIDLKKNGGVTWARYHIRCMSADRGDSKILGYRVQENN